MTDYIAYSGSSIEGQVLGVNDTLSVESGGSADATTVGPDSQMYVLSGGTAFGTVAQDFSVLIVSSGGTANATTVQSGAFVYFEGSANTTVILSGGSANFFDRATATTVGSGGYAVFDAGSTDGGTSVAPGGAVLHAVVSAGQTYTGDTAKSGNGQTVSGTAISTMLSNGAQGIAVGGSGIGTMVDDGGVQTVSSGGAATAAIVNAGGNTQILTGGAANRTEIDGGEQDVEGGAVTNASVNSGGQQLVESGVASNTTVSAGAVQNVVSAGIAYSTALRSGGEEAVDSGGVVYNAIVQGSGIEAVAQGGVASGTIVSSGGTLLVNGTLGNNFTETLGGITISSVQSGGTETITTFSGGVAVGSSVSSGGTRTVYSGGTLDATEVQSGNELYTIRGTDTTSTQNIVYAQAGSAVGGEVQSGATIVFDGGVTLGVAVDSGATEQIGGTISLTVLGASDVISLAGLVVSNNTVTDGVKEIVSSGGSTVGTIIGSGGTALVLSGGVASNSTVSSGGMEVVSSGGKDVVARALPALGGRVVIQSGASQVVSAGGIAFGTTVEAGGLIYVESGGAISGGTVSSGGAIYVESGATASDVQVLSGGIEYDLNGGADDGGAVSLGGTLYVSSGAGEGGVTDGGKEVVLSGGSAGGIKIDNSGVLSFSDSTATGSNTVYAGGVTVFTGNATAGTAGFDVFATGPAFVSSARAAESGSGQVLPRLEAATFAAAGAGAVLFQDSSTAGGATIHVSSGGAAWFEDQSTAGSATIADANGAVGFTNSSTAGSATIGIDGPGVGLFVDQSTAGSASITLSATATSGGALLFANAATAGQATIDNLVVNGDVGGLIAFASGTTAGQATINNQARTTTDLSRALDRITQEVLSGGTAEVAAYKAEQALASFPGQSAVPVGGLLFFDGSTPGSSTINNTGFGLTDFINGATGAASATITNSGGGGASGGTAITAFYSAGAGAATITNQAAGGTIFGDRGSAAAAHITDQSGSVLGLADGADLGSAHIDNQAGALLLALGGNADAATITDGGVILFAGDSTAGNATITVSANSFLGFVDRGDGGSAQVTTTDATAQLDASAATETVSIGSIAGPGSFALGGNTLKVGSANTNTTVTGTVTNFALVNLITGLHFPGVTTIGGEATLDKVGTGTLTLAGTVNQTDLVAEKGALVVTGTITGSSTATIKAGGTLELAGASSESVTFARGATGTLKLDAPESYTGTVGGFGIGQTIVLGVPAAAGASATIAPSGSGSAIMVTDGGRSFSIALADAALGGTMLTTGITDDGMLAISVSARIISTAIVVGDAETLSGAVVASGGSITVQDGGTLSGVVVVSGGGVTVEAGGSALGNIIHDGATETVQDGATARDSYVSDPGRQIVGSGGTAVGAQVSGGEQDVYGSALSASVASGGIQVVESGGVANGTLVGPGGTLLLSGGTATGAAVSTSGAVDFAGLLFASGGSAALDPASDLLTVTEGGASRSVQLAGDYTAEFFQLAGDSGTGTLVTAESVACYCRGTLIATGGGETAVEKLRIGDLVRTASGAVRPVRWIGRRSYSGAFAANNPDVLPVLFRVGSLGEGLPRRDLRVSPLHAMLLDEALIPARLLVNGISIAQAGRVEQVEYFHVELDSHDILLAEGAAAESFVDDDSRGMFHNAAEYRMLYPDAGRPPARYCAPRLEEGEALAAVHRRLRELACPGSSPGTLRGYLDTIGHDRLTGWARDAAAPGERVRLRVLVNGAALGEVVADGERADLLAAGEGDGRHGFVFDLPGGLPPAARHLVEVRRAADGCPLGNVPAALEPAPLARPAPQEPAAPFAGVLDHAGRERLTGWAWQPGSDAPIGLQVFHNGLPLVRILANRYRPDLRLAGIGDGRHGFDVTVPGGLSPLSRHVLEVRRETDGAALPGTPVVIEPANSFDPALESAVARAVAALPAGGEGDRVLSFLLAQTERLLRDRAEAEGGADKRQALRAFQRRWGPEAEAAPDRPDAPGARALVIDARVPVAGRDAGSCAVLSHVRALQELGYAVSLVAADEIASRVPAPPGVALCGAPFYASVEDLLRWQAGCFDLVYLHRIDVAERYMALVRQHMPGARVLYSVADLHHLRLARQADAEGRPELLEASKRVRLAECTAAWSADAVLTHSPAEAAILRAAVPDAKVHHVPWAVPVSRPVRALTGRHGVAFVGSGGHAPNGDAARWLVEAIMPLVWQVDPAIECVLIGSGLPVAVRALERPGVRVLGHAPDLAAALRRVRLTVAPLRYGAGVKGKVLDSFAARTPCVMTAVAAEGLALTPALRALVSDDPAGVAALICRLHRDDAAHRAAVRAGAALLRKEHSEAAVLAALCAAMGESAATASREAG